jgi:hypothetical protein
MVSISLVRAATMSPARADVSESSTNLEMSPEKFRIIDKKQ